MQVDLNEQDREQEPRFQMRVPFLREGLGLGDVIAKATEAVGIEPCGTCQQRRERMNTMMRLNPWET